MPTVVSHLTSPLICRQLHFLPLGDDIADTKIHISNTSHHTTDTSPVPVLNPRHDLATISDPRYRAEYISHGDALTLAVPTTGDAHETAARHPRFSEKSFTDATEQAWSRNRLCLVYIAAGRSGGKTGKIDDTICKALADPKVRKPDPGGGVKPPTIVLTIGLCMCILLVVLLSSSLRITRETRKQMKECRPLLDSLAIYGCQLYILTTLPLPAHRVTPDTSYRER